jgi:hypothetical protein
MRNELQLTVADKTENHARVFFRDAGNALTGIIRGPFSDFAKTLTADFKLKSADSRGAEALITEPCYWTPQLPMRYELHVDDSSTEQSIPFGLKRFYCSGRNLTLESKRIVLRGTSCESPTENDLQLARQYETVLIVTEPTDETCEMASRLGVPLLVKIQNETAIERYTWFPAVFMVLASTGQRLKPSSQVPIGEIVKGSDPEPNGAVQVVIIELGSGERPPAWASTCDKPVIVLRKDPEVEIKTARASCDRLQAELAPQFDLAGYFV